MSLSSKQAKGGKWTGMLIFMDLSRQSPNMMTLKDGQIKDYAITTLDTSNEKIEMTWIYKNNLGSSFIPKWFGFWHEFTVVKSTNYFWSFEKNMDCILVQRAKMETEVKDSILQHDRTGWVEPEGRPPVKGSDGKTVFDIFQWIYDVDYVNKGYHILRSNCHYFASLLYESMGGPRPSPSYLRNMLNFTQH